MQKITPHLWFDKEAKEAAEFYVSIFEGSKIKHISTINNTPSGSVDIVTIELSGQEFMMISAGPDFKFTPAISFMVACKTTEEVDRYWERLSEGGFVMMELGKYPFSEKYGWTQDKYGLSWQISYAGNAEIAQKITPALMFTGKNVGKAEEAIKFYESVFSNSPSPSGETKIGNIMHYEKGEELNKEGTVKYASFMLAGQQFSAMDSGYMHKFDFNEAISLIVSCKDQEEIDYFWDKLSADPKAEQCGWLKDKYGLSWQIVPEIMNEMMGTKDSKKLARVTEAFLKMKKFDIAALKDAYSKL